MVGMDDLVSTTCVEHSNERANELRSSARTEQIEVRVRSERHRRWQPDEKLRMVQETLRPGAVLAEVARRHGIGYLGCCTPGGGRCWRRRWPALLLCRWRRSWRGRHREMLGEWQRPGPRGGE